MRAMGNRWSSGRADRGGFTRLTVAGVLAVWIGVAAAGKPAQAGTCADPAGDLTGNGKVNVADVLCAIFSVLRAINSPSAPPPACLAAGLDADLDCDGQADISDILVQVTTVVGGDLGSSADLDADYCPDACEQVVCGAGGPAICDDGDALTFDVCVEGPGCVAVREGSSCSPSAPESCGPHGGCKRSTLSGLFTCACATGYVGPQCDACAAGYHPEGTLGELGAVAFAPLEEVGGPAAPESMPAPFSCVADHACVAGQCGVHGRCFDDRGAPLCVCEPGYAGPSCSQCAEPYEADGGGGCALGQTCRVERCGSRGSCVYADPAYECECDAGFGGARCEACAPGFHDDGSTCAPDESCAGDPCGPHGTCSDAGGVVACTCDAGWGGPMCDQTCAGQACSGRGTCVVSAEGAACACEHPDLLVATHCAECAPGLVLSLDPTGAPVCELPASCAAGLCGAHGTCAVEPTSGATTCECDSGWAGGTCWRCADGYFFATNDRCSSAAECAQSVCSGHGDCVDAGEGQLATCSCDAGRTGADCAAELPIAAYVLTGHDEVLDWGGSTILSAEAIGVGTFAALEWQLLDGAGTLTPLGPGEAIYTAPTSGPPGIDTVLVGIVPDGCPGQGTQLGLSYKDPVMPWVTGVANALFTAVDNRLMQFMYDRCTGGAVVGLNWKGIPIYRRGYGRDKGRSTPGRPGVSCGPVDPDALPVWPDSPVRVGSNSKALSAAMVRKSAEARLLAYGRLPNKANYPDDASYRADVDAIVENVRILDQDLNLLPISLRLILGSCEWTGANPLDNSYTCTDGNQAPPVAVAISGNGAPQSCSPNPCFNGGTCSINSGGNAVCGCPNGFSGGRCRALTSGSNLAPNGVDRRWQSITLGHLFTHTSGLPNGIESQDLALANLEALRTRHDPSFDVPEDVGPALHDYAPSIPEPGPGEPEQLFLERRPSTFEFIWLQAGRNLDYAPGAVSVYSNLGFILLGAVIDYTIAQPEFGYGDKWGGAPESHLDHAGSRLDSFTRVYFGGWPGDDNPWGATRSRYGMFLARSPNPADPAGSQADPWELEPRDWVGGVLNPPQDDRKGNVCEVNGDGGCDWISGLVDYFGNPGQVQYGYNGNLISAAAGGLVTESNLYLRFMRQFTVGYSSTFPGYGRPRVGWTQASSHNGEWVGAKAHARQVGWRTNGAVCTHRKIACNPGDELKTCCPPGGTCCATNFDCVTAGRPSFPVNSADTSQNECVQITTYTIPTVNATTGDYTPKSSTPTTGGCVLPEGLDIFIATNQTSDSQDVDGTDYDYLQDAVLRGLCAVSWPVNPWLVSPGGGKMGFAP